MKAYLRCMQAPICRICIVPLGVRDKLSNLTFRGGSVTSRSTPKAKSKAFDLSQCSEKRRVEIGYAPRIHAKVPLLNLWISDHAIIQIIQQRKPPPRTPNARCAPRYFYAAGRECADGRRANTDCHCNRVFVCCGRRYPTDDVPSIERGAAGPEQILRRNVRVGHAGKGR